MYIRLIAWPLKLLTTIGPVHPGRHDTGGCFSSRHEEGRARILTRIAEVHDVFGWAGSLRS